MASENHSLEEKHKAYYELIDSTKDEYIYINSRDLTTKAVMPL